MQRRGLVVSMGDSVHMAERLQAWEAACQRMVALLARRDTAEEDELTLTMGHELGAAYRHVVDCQASVDEGCGLVSLTEGQEAKRAVLEEATIAFARRVRGPEPEPERDGPHVVPEYVEMGGTVEGAKAFAQQTEQVRKDPGWRVLFELSPEEVDAQDRARVQEAQQQFLELAGMSEDILAFVMQQRDSVVVFKSNVEDAAAATREGAEIVDKAMDKNSKRRRRLYILGGVAAGMLVGVTGGAVLLPSAIVAAAGGAAGSVAGFVAGRAVGSRHQKGVRAEFMRRARANWQRDEDAIVCNGCALSFSLTRRRHHCRNCGFIFCAQCSDYKMVVDTEGKDPVRACGRCACGAALPMEQQGDMTAVFLSSGAVAERGDDFDLPQGPDPVEARTNPEHRSQEVHTLDVDDFSMM